MRVTGIRFVRSLCAVVLLAGLSVVTAPEAAGAGGPLVYGIDATRSGGNSGVHKGLRPFDASTGLNAVGFIITNDGLGPIQGDVLSGNALAVDPMTDIAWAILQIQGRDTRVLATIDLSDGSATTVGETGLPIAAITFAPDGTLYAVNGGQQFTDPAFCAGCLFELSKVTGQPIGDEIAQLTNLGGQAIAYNATDGFIYHATGNFDTPAQDRKFDKIDPADPTPTVVDVGYQNGGIPDEAVGMGYDAANNRFIVTDQGARVWSVTPAGFKAQLSTMSPNNSFMRGLIVTDDPVPANSPPTAVDDPITTIRDISADSVPVTFPLGNDTDPEDDAISLLSFEQPPNGTVVNFFDNLLSYQPDPGYCNDGTPTDDFTYGISQQDDQGDTGTVTATVGCQHLNVYGFLAPGNHLETFDRATGLKVSGKDMEIVGGPVQGDFPQGHGLAVDPKTSRVYAVVNVDPANDDVLARLDLETGDLTTIRVLSSEQDFDALTLSNAGTLYGITNNSDPCPSCLFKIDKKKGTKKIAKSGLAGDDTNAIAFNPSDGMIYHASGRTFEKIDPRRRFAITQITEFSGDDEPGAVRGLGFDETTGKFILTDADLDVWEVTPAGVASRILEGWSSDSGLIVGTWRQLSLKYSAKQKRFTGALTALREDSCEAGRTVSIIKMRPGPDKLIGQPVTEPDGTYQLQKKAGEGKYYATVDAEVVPPPGARADCRAARSRTVTVR